MDIEKSNMPEVDVVLITAAISAYLGHGDFTVRNITEVENACNSGEIKSNDGNPRK